MRSELGHGSVSTHELTFTHLLPLRDASYDRVKLAALANAMVSEPDPLSDGPDPEENLYVPAGYTYLAQFVDHDLTFDTTSRLNPVDIRDPNDPHNEPTNLRTPLFDLDCLYGNGPGDQPYMYLMPERDDEAHGLYANATMLAGGVQGEAPWDLLRGGNGRALIGDKRNDENSIVNQVHHVFVRFHNRVVDWLAKRDPAMRGLDLFAAAQREVRWTYQSILLQDLLPRIVDALVLDFFVAERARKGEGAYRLYRNAHGLRSDLPREFVAAAYRFGHSMVRTGYRMNTGTRLDIFTAPPSQGQPAPESLVGFDPLPLSHQVDDWGRLFPLHLPPGFRDVSNDGPTTTAPGVDPRVRLQFAYKIDTKISNPLGELPPSVATRDEIEPPALRPLPSPGNPLGAPSLPLLNLLRGNRYLIAGGQAFARALGIPPLDVKYLCIRESADVEVRNQDGSTQVVELSWFQRIDTIVDPVLKVAIGAEFNDDTPLWFYILAEAQKPIVDLWLAKGGGTDPTSQPRSMFLTADDLLGRTPPADPSRGIVAGQGAATRLGPVGGQIVAEVFYGLLDADRHSVLRGNVHGEWIPRWAGAPVDLTGPATFTKLLQAVGLAIT
jgi:hypothetical protein